MTRSVTIENTLNGYILYLWDDDQLWGVSTDECYVYKSMEDTLIGVVSFLMAGKVDWHISLSMRSYTAGSDA